MLTNEQRIGIFFVVGLVLLFIAIELTLGLGLFTHRYTLYATFRDVQGLDTVVIDDTRFANVVDRGRNVLTRLHLGANEILQMAVLEPKLAVLDETDSGLDIDALRIVAGGVNQLHNPENAVILVTHYQRLLDYIVPQFVHVLANGRIAKEGGKELALELEQKGYDWLKATTPETSGAGTQAK